MILRLLRALFHGKRKEQADPNWIIYFPIQEWCDKKYRRRDLRALLTPGYGRNGETNGLE